MFNIFIEMDSSVFYVAKAILIHFIVSHINVLTTAILMNFQSIMQFCLFAVSAHVMSKCLNTVKWNLNISRRKEISFSQLQFRNLPFMIDCSYIKSSSVCILVSSVVWCFAYRSWNLCSFPEYLKSIFSVDPIHWQFVAYWQ